MKYQINELDKVRNAIADQGFAKIALANHRGLLSTWNRSSVSPLEHFDNKLQVYISSNSTPGGEYKILGRHSGSKASNSFEICTIIKPGEPMAETPEPIARSVSMREIPNLKLVEEKSRFEFENKYLEKEVERLLVLIKELEETNAELEEEIEELEDKIEGLETANKTLSESPMNTAVKQLAEQLPQLAVAVLPNLLQKFGLFGAAPNEAPPQQPPVAYGPPAQHQTENSGFQSPWLREAQVIELKNEQSTAV